MTKVDIVENLYDKVGFSKKELTQIVDSVFDIIKETLQREDKVLISGFGNFVIRNKRARRGRNPQTGSEMKISARRILMFKPSNVFRVSVNRTSGDGEGSGSGEGAGEKHLNEDQIPPEVADEG